MAINALDNLFYDVSPVKRNISELATREDIFTDFSEATFESDFRDYFIIQDSVRIEGSERTLYLMRRS